MCIYVYLCIYYILQKDNNKITFCSKQRILIVEVKNIKFRKCPFGKILNKFRISIAISSILADEPG